MTEPVVAVRGEIDREVPPEIATVTVTVAARDRDREATLTRLSDRWEALNTLLGGYTEAFERQETGGVYVYPETEGPGERVVGYRASMTIHVTVKDFMVLGELMLNLADQDQAAVSGPDWALRPDSPAYRQARHDAIGDALARAREYAEALGARVTRLIELADAGLSGSAQTPVPIAMRSFAAADAGGPSLHIEPRLQRVYASVEARLAITEPDLSSRATPG